MLRRIRRALLARKLHAHMLREAEMGAQLVNWLRAQGKDVTALRPEWGQL